MVREEFVGQGPDEPEWLIPAFPPEEDFFQALDAIEAYPDVESFPDGDKEDWPDDITETMDRLELVARESFRVEKPNVLLLCETSDKFKKVLDDFWGPKGEIGTVRSTTMNVDNMEKLDPTQLTEADLADVNIIHCNFPYVGGVVEQGASEATAKLIPEIVKRVCQVGSHGQRFRIGLFVNRGTASINPIMYAPCHAESIIMHAMNKSYEDDSQKCAIMSVWPVGEKPYLQYRLMGYDDFVDERVSNHFMLFEFVLMEKECMKESGQDLEVCKKLSKHFMTRCEEIAGFGHYLRTRQEEKYPF